ncbi:hypothetical protein GALL_379320 [mine drainage metagenome]|uniref:Uncharacterized protein n=1 Tax=mine drainage metagenome TaxID=410659 RepID=A0A1J5QAU6_9ZZZZ
MDGAVFGSMAFTVPTPVGRTVTARPERPTPAPDFSARVSGVAWMNSAD